MDQKKAICSGAALAAAIRSNKGTIEDGAALNQAPRRFFFATIGSCPIASAGVSSCSTPWPIRVRGSRCSRLVLITIALKIRQLTPAEATTTHSLVPEHRRVLRGWRAIRSSDA
jgi:hypothetical protein